MAELTYEQLRHKTLAELRDMAKGSEHEAVQGYTQMNKEHLVVAIAAHDHAQLKVVRRTIHRLKRRIHKATV